MPSRRKFLSQAAIGAAAALNGGLVACQNENVASSVSSTPPKTGFPVVISTWDFGKVANKAAMQTLSKGGSSLDAVEAGVRVVEADPTNNSVGIGGYPDRDGRVTLDACIMGPDGKCGSVCAVEEILHPVTVARMVMERTPHVILVAQGALEFALAQGMEKTNLLTEKARVAWEEWKVESKYQPVINVEQHDTIGMLAIDQKGDIAGACTTSGLAFKMRGRVGDSPIIGAGLFIDNKIGGATATGLGEAMLRTVSSFLVVELMRQGKSPTEACKEAIRRIVETHPDHKGFQACLIAVNKAGETGGYSLHPGFSFAKTTALKDEIIEPPSFFDK